MMSLINELAQWAVIAWAVVMLRNKDRAGGCQIPVVNSNPHGW